METKIDIGHINQTAWMLRFPDGTQGRVINRGGRYTGYRVGGSPQVKSEGAEADVTTLWRTGQDESQQEAARIIMSMPAE